MTSAIRINHFKKEILISKSFEKAANNPNSTEYQDLMEIRKNHPDYTIVQRAIKSPLKKDTYKGLTYEYMENYINAHGGEAELKEFEELRLISKCHRKGLRYPTIKKWFLAKYPDISDFINQEEEKIPA